MRDENGVLLQGGFSCPLFEPGTAGVIGSETITLPKIEKPRKLIFQIALDGTEISNSYECWLFPEREKKALSHFVVSESIINHFRQFYRDVRPYGDPSMTPDDILIARPDDPIVADAEKEGRSLFIITYASPDPDVRLGWWALGTQVGTAFADSPAWGDFPLDPWMNALWFRMIRKGAFDLREAPPIAGLRPLAVGEGRDSYYLYLGESFENNRHVLISFALDVFKGTPEANYLLDSLLTYLLETKLVK